MSGRHYSLLQTKFHCVITVISSSSRSVKLFSPQYVTCGNNQANLSAAGSSPGVFGAWRDDEHQCKCSSVYLGGPTVNMHTQPSESYTDGIDDRTIGEMLKVEHTPMSFFRTERQSSLIYGESAVLISHSESNYVFF